MLYWSEFLCVFAFFTGGFFMKKNCFLVVLTTIFFLSSFSFADTLGPTSELYVTVWANAGIAVLQGNSIVRSWATSGTNEIAIAVTDKVRTMGHTSGSIGAEYTLSGSFTGNRYTSGQTYFHDGASDGQYNYAVIWNTGNIYRYGLDWQNPQYLFNAGADGLGITYDPTNNSLWLSSWGNGTVKNFSLAGNLLSSFTTRDSHNTALAMDYADGTLWMRENSTGYMAQYTRTGTFLGAKSYSVGGAIWGAEFSVTVVPEPGSLFLFAFALITVRILHRRR